MNAQGEKTTLVLNDYVLRFDDSRVEVNGPDSAGRIRETISIKFHQLREKREGKEMLLQAAQTSNLRLAVEAQDKLIAQLGIPEKARIYAIGFNSYRVDFGADGVAVSGAQRSISDKIMAHFGEFMKTPKGVEFLESLKFLARQLSILGEAFTFKLNDYSFKIDVGALVVDGPDMGKALNLAKPAIIRSSELVRLIVKQKHSEHAADQVAAERELVQLLGVPTKLGAK